jgi:hypothetical protein
LTIGNPYELSDLPKLIVFTSFGGFTSIAWAISKEGISMFKVNKKVFFICKKNESKYS